MVLPRTRAGRCATLFTLLCGLALIPVLPASSASALTVEELDFGDAPLPYSTLIADDGARHRIDPQRVLGNIIDGEFDGFPSLLADGDDLDGALDDEDGIFFSSPLNQGGVASIIATASMSGLLNAWIDFDQDGDWLDAGEAIFTDTALGTGPNVLAFLVPADAVVGSTYARFRFNSTGGLAPTGLAENGEVEDYAISISPVPEPRVFALLVSGLVGLGLRRRRHWRLPRGTRPRRAPLRRGVVVWPTHRREYRQVSAR